MLADRDSRVLLTLILICVVALLASNVRSGHAQRSPADSYVFAGFFGGHPTLFVPRTGDIWVYRGPDGRVMVHWRVVEPGKPLQVIYISPEDR